MGDERLVVDVCHIPCHTIVRALINRLDSLDTGSHYPRYFLVL